LIVILAASLVPARKLKREAREELEDLREREGELVEA
jgi:hypothetical protein